MTYIWIDLWDKRTWIATSFNGISMPYKTVDRVKIISEIKKIINEKKDIKWIVVWLPFDLYWVDTRQLDKTKKFTWKLKEIFPEINIFEEDERFTSFWADQVMKTSKSKNKLDRDKIAAALILESFLDKREVNLLSFLFFLVY